VDECKPLDPGEVYGGYNGVTRATTEVCPRQILPATSSTHFDPALIT